MGSSIGGMFFSAFYLLFMGVIIVFLAYVVTRMVGSKYMKNLKGKNISIVESVSIGLDKGLYLVKVGKQYLLLSSSGKNINFLSQIETENITVDSESGQAQTQILDIGSFAKYLEKFKKKLSKRKENEHLNRDRVQIEAEQSNIENNIQKMRSLFSNVKAPNKDGVEN